MLHLVEINLQSKYDFQARSEFAQTIGSSIEIANGLSSSNFALEKVNP